MYKGLLVSDRIRTSSRGARPLVEEVESDRARVLYSASLRRLQRKTQVFPLENNASVRTRLTHSLEVAHVGRFIAAKVIETFRARKQLSKMELDGDMAHVFATNVEVACLLHDIGNPPFGHFGEIAISHWFKEHLPGLEDFQGFDGNPQGFRIVTKLAGADGETGMNLTLTQLASILKYPATRLEKNRYKKFGVFATEENVLREVRQKFGLVNEQRFALAYLMEAADDISYCLSDIEDGVEKGIISYEDVVEDLSARAQDGSVRKLLSQAKNAAKNAPAVDKVVSFRSDVIRNLVNYVAKTYVSRHAEVMAGSLKEIIEEQSAPGKLLRLVKQVMRERVYSHSSIQSLELGGLSVIRGILDKFKIVLDLSRADFRKLLEPGARLDGLDVQKRLVDQLAPRHKLAYLKATEACSAEEELAHRSHMVVDYVSGMTDLFALETHKVLGGTTL